MKLQNPAQRALGVLPLPPPRGAPPPFLVVVRAGRRSLHPGWRAPHAGFDLLVAAYEPTLDPGPLHRDLPGTKLQGYAALFAREPALLERYSHIALIDDDIATDAAAIGACFAAGVAARLDIWQPSLSWRSYFSYGFTLHNPLTALRYCNFIEMMCPFFSSEALRRALPLFGLGWETGIDRLWCRLAPEGRFRYAVIDGVQVTHTRPVGTTASAQGMVQGYDAVLAAMAARTRVAFRGPVVYGVVWRGGRRRISRATAVLAALAGFGALRRTPVGRCFAAMRLLDHLRHILTRPLALDPVEVSRTWAP